MEKILEKNLCLNEIFCSFFTHLSSKGLLDWSEPISRHHCMKLSQQHHRKAKHPKIKFTISCGPSGRVKANTNMGTNSTLGSWPSASCTASLQRQMTLHKNVEGNSHLKDTEQTKWRKWACTKSRKQMLLLGYWMHRVLTGDEEFQFIYVSKKSQLDKDKALSVRTYNRTGDTMSNI